MKYSFFHSSSLLFSKIKVAADGIHDFFFPDVVAAVGPGTSRVVIFRYGFAVHDVEEAVLGSWYDKDAG
jgi:hypothetical protein